ncbi:MAG: phosphotriesterase family protein [Solirubrobacteraceae bacterium]
MPTIETTAGPIEDSELGRTLGHEHLLSSSEATRAQFPHLYDRELEHQLALDAVRAAMAHGVKTIVDPCVQDLGRDIHYMAQVAEETGIQLVAATGIYLEHYTFLPHFFQNRDEDVLVGAFVHDLEQGIQGTDIKAAFLKCAADALGITPDVEKLHRAVAKASLQTGASIMAHSAPKEGTGLEQMKLFTGEGVDPAKVQIAHTGDTDDLDYIEKLLATGATIGMDRYGLDMFLPQDQRDATVIELVKRGYAERMVLSHDYCAFIDWYPIEMAPVLAPKWSMTLIFEEVLPTLHAAGVTEEQTDLMLGETTRRWLTA